MDTGRRAHFDVIAWQQAHAVSIEELALLCAVSRRTVIRWRVSSAVPPPVLRIFQTMEWGAPTFRARDSGTERGRAHNLPHGWRQAIYGTRASDGDWRTWCERESPQAQARAAVRAIELAAVHIKMREQLIQRRAIKQARLEATLETKRRARGEALRSLAGCARQAVPA